MQSQTMDKYKSIIWDFDGVILNSNAVRDMGFSMTLKDFPEDQVSALLAYHVKNGGLSRYHKFRYFFEVIRKEKATDEQILEYASAFKEIMLKHLCNPNLLINETINFIRENYDKYVFHIASGSDEMELNKICKSLKIDHYFKSINGSPTPKNELVKNILIANKFDTIEYSLIGDSINDFEAAKINEITFFGFNNIKLRENHSYIDTFSPLRISRFNND